MSKLSFQFHAMPEDLPWLIDQIASDEVVVVAGFRRENSQVSVLENPISSSLANEMAVIGFTFGAAAVDVVSVDEYRRKNPDALILEVGLLTERGLMESWIYAMTENAEAMRGWRSIVKKLRVQMLSGVVAMNPITGAIAPMPNHRFSVAAKDAALNGQRMLPAAGNSILLLSEAE